jgi:hypothetical protein
LCLYFVLCMMVYGYANGYWFLSYIKDFTGK